MISIGSGRTIKVWDTESGLCLKTLTCYINISTGFYFDCTGNLYSGFDDGTIKCLNLSTQEFVTQFYGHRSMISCLELVEEEKYLFSGSKDNIVMQWDMTTGDCIKSFKGHSGEILFIRKIPGKNKIITAARDYTIKVWDILSGKCVALLSANLQINSLTPVQANGRFAYGTLEGEFKIIDLVNI